MNKKYISLIFIMAFLFACGKSEMTQDEAIKKTNKLIQRVNVQEDYKHKIDILPSNEKIDISSTLPEIDQYAMVVNNDKTVNNVVVEIFTSTEKSGSGTDGWMTETAIDFNNENFKISNGKTAKLNIRKIPSGTGYQYIASRKYIPDAFCPSNLLWIKMAQASGIDLIPISERTVRNIAGIIMKDEAYKKIEAKYGKVDVRSIINSVINGDIFMGYTDPFASSTGINFLYTILAIFADNNEKEILSDAAVSAFQEFQKGVPFVSLTTLQMRDSVEKGGSLDAFIMEYQTYVNTKTLYRGYQFIPFGILHENPLYALKDIDKEKKETLAIFARYINENKIKNLAKKYGFEPDINYKPEINVPDGRILIQAQKLWKEEKDAGKPIVAVFVSDVSGSMEGLKIKMLKKALIDGSKFISPDNYIGLTAFSSGVVKLLPIEKFTPIQRSRFIAAVNSMQIGGNTAMYDGILVSAAMLFDAMKNIPNSRPMLFILTDGESNSGHNYRAVYKTLIGLHVPIYTISYGGTVTVLEDIAKLNEAASLKAKENDIAYQIGNLLNAEM